MTLIVGRVTEDNQIIILGDTKISLKNDAKTNPYTEGCLKQYIVNEKLAFGFAADNVEGFEDIISLLLKCNNAKDIVETALKLKKRDERLDFDLLIGEVNDSELTILKGMEIFRTSATYIGNKDAYEEYQNYYHNGIKTDTTKLDAIEIKITRVPEVSLNLNNSTNNNIYNKMFNAFKETINNSSLVDVGGAIIPLCTDDGSFCYINYAEVFRNQIDWSQYYNEPKIIDFGTPQNGSYIVELCSATLDNKSKSDIGLYFKHGGFGVIFPEKESKLRKAEIIQAENPVLWAVNSGTSFTHTEPEMCETTGETLAKQKDWARALVCYQMVKDPKHFMNRPHIYDRFIAVYSIVLFNNGFQNDSIVLLESAIKSDLPLPMCQNYIKKIKDLISK